MLSAFFFIPEIASYTKQILTGKKKKPRTQHETPRLTLIALWGDLHSSWVKRFLFDYVQIFTHQTL